MKRLFKLKFANMLIGMGAATGAATYYFFNSPNNKVHASWTTNYEPPFTAKWNDNWDHRSPDVLSNPKKKNGDEGKNGGRAIRHLILIRHGQYNLDGRTDDDRILTKLGRMQAEHTGKRLKELALPYTALVKSTMSRAQETGTIISESLPEIPVTNCDLLREGAPIPPEPPLGSWKQEQYQFYIDGARIEAAFRKYFHRAEPEQVDDTYTILVCHANVIRYFVCRALQFPAEAWLRLSLNNASITWVSITPSGRVILRCLGDSGHMPPEHVTTR